MAKWTEIPIGGAATAATTYGLFEADDWELKLQDPAADQTVTALQHEAEVNDLALSFDGRWLLSAGDDSLVKVWSLGADDLVAGACAHVPRNLTRDEWRRFVGEAEPYRLTCPELGERGGR